MSHPGRRDRRSASKASPAASCRKARSSPAFPTASSSAIATPICSRRRPCSTARSAGASICAAPPRATGAVREQEAIVRSGAGGAVVLETEAGFEALRCTGLHETLVYDRVPPGLSARPTLSVRDAQPRSGDRHRDPVLPRHRPRLAGQLCRDPVARRGPDRPVRLADPGQWRRDQLRRTPTPRPSPGASTANMSGPSRRRAGRSSCNAGRRGRPATSRRRTSSASS